MHRIQRVRLSGLVGLLGLLCLAGCGEGADRVGQADGGVEETAVENRANEAEVMRQAAENRKRFLGDGKAQYTPNDTPQPVERF